MKTCSKCKEDKEFSEFNKRKLMSDGYRSECRECQSVYCKSHYSKQDKEKHLERGRAWHRANPHKSKEYKNKRRGYYNAHESGRRARMRTKLSSDAKFWLVEIYEAARLRTDATGVAHHVDHIIPLNGKLVSGLHVPWNMQVIPAAENLAKGNKHG